MNPKTLCDQYTKEQLAERVVELEIKVAKQSQQRTQALGKLEDATKCDMCDDQAEYRQCQSCMNDRLIGSHNDTERRELEAQVTKLKRELLDERSAHLVGLSAEGRITTTQYNSAIEELKSMEKALDA